MANNGRIFVSHSHADNERCALLLTALDAWGVDYFFDTQGLTAGQQLNAQIQREIASRDIMLRVCTAQTKQSFWMTLEGAAFQGLQAEDQRKRRGEQRVLINLILDGDYSREPFEAATLFIDTTNRPRGAWLADLGRAIGVTGRGVVQRLSRRTMLSYGAAAAVAVGSAAAAGGAFLDYHPVSADQSPTPHTPGSLVWKLPHASQLKDIPPSAVVVGNDLYTLSGTQLARFDLTRITANGPTMLWSQKFNPQHTFCAPTVSGDVLYFGIDYTLHAYTTSGKKLWSAQSNTGGPLYSGLPLGHGAIFALDNMGGLHAFHTSDGSELWHATVENAFLADVASNPAADGAGVYIGSLDHHVYCFNASDGSVRWKTLTRGKVLSSPQVVSSVVYVGSSDNYFYALNAHDGSVKWKYLTGDSVNSSPAVVDGVVYFASDDYYLYTLDAETGKPYWRALIGDLEGAGAGIPTNTGNVTTGVAVTGDCVCVMDSVNYMVRGYTRSNGAARWKYTSKDALFNAGPVGAHGLILFGSGDNTLYAFGA